jgi:hypothetical protein
MTSAARAEKAGRHFFVAIGFFPERGVITLTVQ